MRKSKAIGRSGVLVTLGLSAILVSQACGSGGVGPTSAAPAPAPAAPPPAAPRATEGATVTITSTGFEVREFHILQGSRLTFVNRDLLPHDIESDPFHVHTDCPPLNVVGFLTPGQSRASDPLTEIRTCGFHSHDFEGNEAFHGSVTIEPR